MSNEQQSPQKDTVVGQHDAPASPGLQRLVSGLKDVRPFAKTDGERRTYWDTVLIEFLKQVASGTLTYQKDLAEVLEGHIAAIDSRVGEQLDEILHHPDFQRLEASWRSLYQFVANSDTGQYLKIQVLSVSRDELRKDLVNAKKIDETELFKRIYNRGLGKLRGQPLGMLVGDFEFGPSKNDIDLLDRLGQLAFRAQAPFVAAASPQMFESEKFDLLEHQVNLHNVMEKPTNAMWRGLREKEHSKFLGLVMPHVLVRAPHEVVGPQGLEYREQVAGDDNSKYLWGNAAYSFAGRVTDAFAKHGWCVAMRGVHGGGKVEDLPVHHYVTGGDRPDRAEQKVQWPVDLGIIHRQEDELSNLGFIPLVHLDNSSQAAFISAASVYKASTHVSDRDTANDALAAQLPYTFALCRFAHHIKWMVYDRIGLAMGRRQLEDLLHNWIHLYVEPSADATHEMKAKRPLSSAVVEVMDKPGKPGAYDVSIRLKPHFLLDQVDVRLTMVADLDDLKV